METNYYLDFEDNFRGKRKNIIDKLSIYDQLIETIVDSKSSPKLLDIGCGRGEWLQKWKNKFNDISGIDSDQKMIETCRHNNLNVIEGDATKVLSKFANQSVNIITIFHLIEHLNHEKLLELLIECQRVLTNNGVLIMETPNIDNLLVSSKSFHIDPTHINLIHPDLIAFDLKKVGFSNVKTYNINCGPLNNATPLKITRVLNGVAQDLCIVATKQKETFDMLIKKKTTWETTLNNGITTLEAAVEFDIKLENLLKQLQEEQNRNKQLIIEDQAKKINILEKDLLLLKSRLKIVFILLNVIKKSLKPIIFFIRFLRKSILILLNNIFNFFIRYKIIRDLLISKRALHMINFVLQLIKGPSSINAIQIENKFNKLLDRDTKFILQNKKLLLHYRMSAQSRSYKNLFSKKK
tara:strand:+ start:187 stop:1413 length:1227 start_codon:yes stop_codon:yes gene_type:complete